MAFIATTPFLRSRGTSVRDRHFLLDPTHVATSRHPCGDFVRKAASSVQEESLSGVLGSVFASLSITQVSGHTTLPAPLNHRTPLEAKMTQRTT
jgi:hypothetical protein